MDGQIPPRTTKESKNTRYMILILFFDFLFLVGLEMKVRERKKNGMTKRDSGQGV
jgi:hypothetical protein